MSDIIEVAELRTWATFWSDFAIAATPMADTVHACHQAAAEIGRRLSELRRFLLGQEDHLTAATRTDFQALLTSFDIYARMLDDTLMDIAAGPCHGWHGNVPSPRLAGPARRGDRPPGDRHDLRNPLRDGATEIITELRSLKRMLEPLRDTRREPVRTVFTGLMTEWDIATDGLFGRKGVLAHIARTMDLEWTSHRTAMWGYPAGESMYQ